MRIRSEVNGTYYLEGTTLLFDEVEVPYTEARQITDMFRKAAENVLGDTASVHAKQRFVLKCYDHLLPLDECGHFERHAPDVSYAIWATVIDHNEEQRILFLANDPANKK